MPTAALRKKLWRALVPAECPVHSDVDYDILANNYEFCGGFIKNIIFKVASRVALRSDGRVLTMNDFLLGSLTYSLLLTHSYLLTHSL